MDPLIQNAVHIARHGSKNPLPTRSLDGVNPAHGMQEMVKLTRLLSHDDTMTRDKALVALHSALQKPQLRASGVDAGIVEALQSNLGDASVSVRAHAAAAFNMLCGHPLGVSATVAGGAVPELIKLLGDKEETVRVTTYEALVTIAKSVAGAPRGCGWSGNTEESGGGGGAGSLTDCAGFVSSIVAKCKSEPDHLKPFALDLLGALLQQARAVDEALLSVPNGIDVMTALLASSSSSVREKAAENLAPLTFPVTAKGLAIAAGSIEGLVGLLSDSDFKARAGAASALGAICVDEAAREHAVANTPILDVLPAVVADTYDAVQLFAIKLLGIFLERPAWREALRPVQETLTDLLASYDPNDSTMTRTKPYVIRSAKRTVPLFNKVGEPNAF